ncbi:MFS multidrug transporter-like protein [Mollisia scopiformis]|uniref:MFS multidrug transporter-like protein n=1 Tax=Mollisia scopiformis TaxID=149040 RepID=A0A194WZW3_MOLSC|nr:MFS multidrug transporter-like protein [Mollisia scopiformis]KUJ13244.1 MFS multidrug transporter-like protein [Mollisia scopiformis]
MESSIVSTSIVTITNELKGFDKSAWVFNSFLLAYSGLMIIWAKLSDIFGRKPLLLLSLFLFIVFSGACGASRTLVQLIIFRCLQGIGASGIFSLVVLIFYELVPPRKWPMYTAMNTLVVTCSLTFAPIFGGLINIHGLWRWIFLLNIPAGVIAMVMLILFLPNTNSRQPQPWIDWRRCFALKSVQRVDILGTVLLLAVNTFLVTALEQAASGTPFRASLVLSLLMLTVVILGGFLMWEWYITTRRTLPEPVFPWRFVQNRVAAGMFLNSYFAGTIFLVCTVQIPQRFETINKDSAFRAGIRLIAFVLFVPTSSAFAAILLGKSKIPHCWILLSGCILNIAGTVGLSMTSTSTTINSSQYGFQILTGIGVGLFNGVLILLIPYVVEKRDLGVGSATISQLRVLGGVLGLAIVTSVTNNFLRSELSRILAADQVELLLQSVGTIDSLPESLQSMTRSIFAHGYNLQMKIMIGFAVAQVPVTLLMWAKKPIMAT